MLHYHLADDELEISRRRANAGRDVPAVPQEGEVLQEHRVVPAHRRADDAHDAAHRPHRPRRARDEETFEADFRWRRINGATFLGCDEFTRDYYTKVYGVMFEDIPVQFDENVERRR